MAIYIRTSSPQGLLDAICDAIDEGHIVTWSADDNGGFFHTPAQWKDKARLHYSIQAGVLAFSYSRLSGSPAPENLRGVYHGRFIEMLITHFSGHFTSIETKLPQQVLKLQRARR